MTKWVTVREAMTIAGRSRTQIYNWIALGHVRAARRLDDTLVVDADHLREVEPTIRRGRPIGTARPRHGHRAS